MKKTLVSSIGALALASSLVGASGALAASAFSEAPALERTAVSWSYYAARGNAQKACLLQTEQSVNGVACDQLPGYGKVFYCPAARADEPRRGLTPAEQIIKVKVSGETGRVVLRSANRKSGFRATAGFAKLDGRWRISYFQWPGHRLSPAGLIFTEGKEARETLWPLSC